MTDGAGDEERKGKEIWNTVAAYHLLQGFFPWEFMKSTREIIQNLGTQAPLSETLKSVAPRSGPRQVCKAAYLLLLDCVHLSKLREQFTIYKLYINKLIMLKYIYLHVLKFLKFLTPTVENVWTIKHSGG